MVLPVLACAPGCGSDDVDRARERVRTQIEQARATVEARIERFRKRIEEVLADLRPVVPRARTTDPEVGSQGRMTASQVDDFLTGVLQNIDGYWTKTLRANDLPDPRVGFVAVPVGRVLATGCGSPAGPDAAFYCPADDTIYVAEQFAADLSAGVVHGLPGDGAGYGRAAGDFAVAYVLAHEYAHNIQQELGLFDNRSSPQAEPFELQADFLAGTWAHSV